MTAAQLIERELIALRNEEKAAHLSRFFKSGPGEYGEGDRFLGVAVPQTRAIVKTVLSESAAVPSDVELLTRSPWHEVRLAGFLVLVNLYKQALKRRDEAQQQSLADLYLQLIPRGNNWDLVDLVAPKVLGEHALRHPSGRPILHQLASREGDLWAQRVGVVATWTLLRVGIYSDTLAICERLLDHPHDLIHKATGWMLREMGKRGGETELIGFLDRHALRMPRTMLRYSIERLPQDLSRHYLLLR